MSSKFEPLLDKTRPLFLRTLPLNPTLRVVVLAPHPDDFDAIGISMRTLQENGNPIDVTVLTSGASGVEDDFDPQLRATGEGSDPGTRAKGELPIFWTAAGTADFSTPGGGCGRPPGGFRAEPCAVESLLGYAFA